MNSYDHFIHVFICFMISDMILRVLRFQMTCSAGPGMCKQKHASGVCNML